MVYEDKRPDGTIRITGRTGGGTPGEPGEDGEDGLTPDLRATSVSSVTIGTGSKTFALSPAMNVAFPVGAVVRVTGATSTNYMVGNVTAATTTSVTINVTETGGVGTFASWTLVVGGFRGPTGLTGTRWGTTPVWIIGPSANREVAFHDGLPPRVGDLVVSSNGLGPGDVYNVTAVVDATHADLARTGVSLRGPEGPPGDAWNSWPVGSIMTVYGSFSPATLLGGGTWEQIGMGRTLVGQWDDDPDFATDGAWGGEKTHVLTINEMPSHDHAPGTLTVIRKAGVGTSTGAARGNATADGDLAVNGATGSRGGGAPHNNMPPYLVVRFWRRTA